MDGDPLTYFESIILGIVQGITEFFPVSSDGHLVVARELLNYHRDLLVFDVFLHLGTLGALFVVFRKETLDLMFTSWTAAKSVFREKSLRVLADRGQNQWATSIWITTFVTGCVGLFAEGFVRRTFESVSAAGVGFLITSAFLFVGWSRRNGKKTLSEETWLFPVLIGMAQAAALLPGVSRSGLTISTALLLGMKREEAGRYSFIVAIPIIAIAAAYELRHLLQSSLAQLSQMVVGVIVSFIVGIFAIKGLLLMIRKLSLYPFAIYAGLLGIVTLIVL